MYHLSTLDATKDHETFLELFEDMAFRENECYQVQSTIMPNGGSGGTIGVTGYAERGVPHPGERMPHMDPRNDSQGRSGSPGRAYAAC